MVEQIDYGFISILVMVVLTMYAVIATYAEHKQLHVLSDAAIAIIMGGCVGTFLLLSEHQVSYSFSKNIFFFVLLPIIVFKEGYSMNKHHFFKNFFYVVLYGVIGTIFNFIFTAVITILIRQVVSSYPDSGNWPEFTNYSIVFYSACISSKDSSLVLQLLNFKKRPKLFSIMFGEQMLNDLVVFSLQKAVNVLQHRYISRKDIFEDWQAYFELIGILLEQIVVSILVGLVVGLAFTWITKHFRFITHHNAICTALTIYSGYLAFAVCESWEFSGVVSVLLCGALMSHYLTYNLSKNGSHSSKVTIQALAYVCETFIYIYLGFSLTGYWASSQQQQLSYSFTLVQVLIILPLSRLMSMATSHGIALTFRMKTRNKWRINRYEFLVIFFSGLIRGPVAYALIQNEQIINTDASKISEFVTESTAIFIVVITTILIGGVLKYFLEWTFKAIETNPRYHQDHPSMKETFIRQSLSLAEIDLKSYKKFTSKTERFFHRFDEDYLKPFLIYNYKERRDDIREAKKEQKKREALLHQDSFMEAQMFDDSVRLRRLKREQTERRMIDGEMNGNLTETLQSNQGEVMQVQMTDSMNLQIASDSNSVSNDLMM